MRTLILCILLLGLSACASQGIKQVEVKRMSPEETGQELSLRQLLPSVWKKLWR